MTHNPQLTTAISQLLTRTGRMAELGSEDGVPKLDWVDAVQRLIDHSTWPEDIEAEARAIIDRGIKHVIWAGMGGSIMAVRTLIDMGFGDGAVTIHPLDSTDPAALNRIVESIAKRQVGSAVDSQQDARGSQLTAHSSQLLATTLMIAVSMGMTSEEPISHLRWFTGILLAAGLDPADHLLVMTLPGSYLDRFAQEHGAPSRPLQLDGGTGTGGRMSAPGTRVFLLPVALWLAQRYPSGTLRAVLRRAWTLHDLDGAARDPDSHSFVRMANTLSEASDDGCCRLLLDLPDRWEPTLPWIEQLMEESLGKGGKGVIVFGVQPLNARAPFSNPDGLALWHINSGIDSGASIPYLEHDDPVDWLAGLAAFFLGWQLAMALYGYLRGITFAGQPAVEAYKSRARMLRERGDPLASLGDAPSVHGEGVNLYLPPAIAPEPGESPAAVVAAAMLSAVARAESLSYVDVTVNGEIPASWEPLWSLARSIANERLGAPIKIRRAPAAYHSTEQSEMNGPPGVVSLRILTRQHEEAVIGAYDDTFLQAQAVATWQAMVDAERVCVLLIVDGGAEAALTPLLALFEELGQQLS